MKFIFGIILTAHCVLQSVTGAFTWSNCAPADAPVQITSLEMGPDPLTIPGDITLSLQGASTKPIGSSALHMSIKRKSFIGELPIPCIGNIGSCTYLDTCTILDQIIRENWFNITTDLGNQIKTMLTGSGIDPSVCPQPPNTLNIDHQSLHLPTVPSALSHFAAGDYHARIYMTDNASGAVTFCIDARFTMAEKDPCTGIFCLIGK